MAPTGYQTASFRGATFFTQESTTTFGRRQAVYELPFDERGAAHIDLGRAPRKYQIRAILVGRPGVDSPPVVDYTALRDKLIVALEKPGPGLLVHPYYGRVMVVVRGECTISESTEQGGMAVVSFNAIEVRDELPPAQGSDSTVAAAQTVKKAAGDYFELELTVESTEEPIPDFVSNDVFNTLDGIIDELRDLGNLVTAATEVPGAFGAQANAISVELAQLIQTPRMAFDAIDGLMETLFASVGRVYDLASDTDKLAPFGSSRVPRTSGQVQDVGRTAERISTRDTRPREIQRKNRAVIMHTTKAAGIANATLALTENSPTSKTEALLISQQLNDQIAVLADSSVEGYDVPADLYAALKDMAASLHRYMDDVASQAGQVRIHTTTAAIPAELLAYQLYGDAERVSELLERNRHIANQGMVPAQTEVEVLDR